jgi:hypothetical protein
MTNLPNRISEHTGHQEKWCQGSTKNRSGVVCAIMKKMISANHKNGSQN